MRPALLRFPTLLVLAVLLGAGCASSSTRPAVAWRDGMQSWFDNGSVDPDEPPRSLWDARDEDALMRRLGYADVVAVGTLRLVAQVEDHSRPSQLTLAFGPDELLFGALDERLDERRQLMLRLDPGSPDFEVARKIQRQLPGTRYLVFFKQRPGLDGARRLLWSFYRPSAQLLAEVRTRYRWLEHERSAHRPAG